MSFSKENYINQIVLQAKIGNKTQFENLRKMYSSLEERIYETFCQAHPFARYRRFEVFHDFYVSFWRAVNTYSYGGEFSFSTHLYDFLFESVSDTFERFGVSREDTKRLRDLSCFSRKKYDGYRRYFLRQTYGALTPKQKMVLSVKYYEHKTLPEAAEDLGTVAYTVYTHVKSASARIKRRLDKVKSRLKPVLKGERIYPIAEYRVKVLRKEKNTCKNPNTCTTAN